MRLFISVTLILLLGVFSVQASKLGEGRKSIGGTVTFYSQSGDMYENANGDGITMFQLSPMASMFLSPGLEVGVQVSFSSTSQGDASTTAWAIGPGINYYFGATEDKDMYPYVGAAFGYGSQTSDNGTTDVTTTGTKIRFAGGILYFLNNYVGVRGQVIYDLDSSKQDVSGAKSIDGSQFGVEAGFSIFID